jgi:MFS family permease
LSDAPLSHLFPASATADAARLVSTRAMRGFADGAISILLPAYLTALHFSSIQIGAIVFGTLFGSAMLTLWVGLASHRIGRRAVLFGAAALMAATGIGFASVRSFWPMFAIAVVGTMNPSAGDVSLFLPAEQAAMAETVVARDLTSAFALYNVGGALAGAIGALASGIPIALSARFGWNSTAAVRAAFLGYSAIAVIVTVVYATLSRAVDQHLEAGRKAAPLAKSRRIVINLSALFSIDAFGGGFIVQSLLALWLFRRFSFSVQTAGSFFFAAGLLGALSQFLSSPIAARIGRIRTMAYTHIPANLLVIAAALAPGAKWAVALLLLRFSMSSMDVPARQSFVMAIVPPEERAAAAGVTNVPRSLASAFAPLLSGAMLAATTFGWPLICCGGLKVFYDLLLLAQFRSVRPADEMPIA